MQHDAFDYFLNDILIRRLETSDWILQQVGSIDALHGPDLTPVTPQQREAFRALYDASRETLRGAVKIRVNEDLLPPERIDYHPRFGWVLQSLATGYAANEAKIFLGKLNLSGSPCLHMGRRSYMSGPCELRGSGVIEIGSFCSLAESLKIYAYNDGHPTAHAATMNFRRNGRIVEDALEMPIEYPELAASSSDITIGNDVWIGRNVSIKAGVKIGDGCIIGEQSLVKHDCEPFAISAGTPARLIRYRFAPDIIEQLRTLQWWHWPLTKIRSNRRFFATDLSAYSGALADLLEA